MGRQKNSCRSAVGDNAKLTGSFPFLTAFNGADGSGAVGSAPDADGGGKECGTSAEEELGVFNGAEIAGAG